jgi:hypothetical protein
MFNEKLLIKDYIIAAPGEFGGLRYSKEQLEQALKRFNDKGLNELPITYNCSAGRIGTAKNLKIDGCFIKADLEIDDVIVAAILDSEPENGEAKEINLVAVGMLMTLKKEGKKGGNQEGKRGKK